MSVGIGLNKSQVLRRRLSLVGAIFLLLLPALASASWFADKFVDPGDGYLDVSNWLAGKTGFPPVPIIITEPAVGYGGGLALAFFHGQFTGKTASPATQADGSTNKPRRIPPSVSAVAAGGTDNGTWFVGGGHYGIWRDDTVRYLGGGGYAAVQMEYYGRSGELANNPVHFASDALGLVQDIQFRLKDSNFFAGLGYQLIDTQNTFDLSSIIPVPGLPDVKFSSRSAGVSVFLNYDNRNNIFTPSRGTDAEIKVGFYGKTWGGDDNFNKYSGYIKHYRQLGDKWVLGLRGAIDGVSGDAPFYEYPFIEMRGIKMMRYQGEKTVLGELELRWALSKRWALIGFGGAGKAYGVGKAKDSDVIYSKGIGFRYFVAAKLGLQMGIDVAKGPEDSAIYFQVGSAWLK